LFSDGKYGNYETRLAMYLTTALLVTRVRYTSTAQDYVPHYWFVSMQLVFIAIKFETV